MDFQELFTLLIKVVILPTIPIIGKFLVDFLRTWVQSKTAELDNAYAENQLNAITDIILQAVTCTTQTYVESLKKQGKFDTEAQQIAFQTTKDAVLLLLTQESKDFISKTYGDLNLWLDSKIEQMVCATKSEIA